MNRVFNFGAGPAMLPLPVLKQIQEEFLNFNGMGMSLIEISHRSKEFAQVIDNADALMKELCSLPANFKILYVHGGGKMQFSAIPLNLLDLKPARKAAYFETGDFAKLAIIEAKRFGDIVVAASSAESNYDRIPAFDASLLSSDLSYVHITNNNTIYGTRWHSLPDTGDIPLVIDATSDMLSREIDFSKVGVIFAGLQKNLGPAGLACVVIRGDLLGHACAHTPSLLDYSVYEKSHSLNNTNNTFAIYVMSLVLQWIKDQGGVKAVESVNNQKAKILYDLLDHSNFYVAAAHPEHRSVMNVTFNLADSSLLDEFLQQAKENGLQALKGHRSVGGVRASIYNAMPIEGVETLAAFMNEFEKSRA